MHLDNIIYLPGQPEERWPPVLSLAGRSGVYGYI
nr:MAG TPA: hypothetical protein [Caudoviricetes sp.]